MKHIIAMALAVAALAGVAFADEVNLRTIAVEDGSGNLVVYSDGHDIWAAGREADKAFDGSIRDYDFYDPQSVQADTWTGYEVSTPSILTRIRYYGRSEGAAVVSAHLAVSQIEGANSSDFSDAVVLHSFNQPKGYAGGSWVEEFVVPKTQSFKYFRVIERYYSGGYNSAAGLLRELEFYGVQSADEAAAADDAAAAGAADVVPSDATVETLNIMDQYPVISATIQRPYSEIAVLRAPGEGGPWTVVGIFNDSTTFTDTTCPIGVPCYYRVASAYTDSNGTSTIGVTNETTVCYRRQHLLERDWSDMTQLKSGVNLIYRAGTGYWSGTSVADSVRRAFDNEIGKYGEGPNISSGSPRTCIGVDFGSDPCYVTAMRLNFQYDNDKSRLTGIVLAGSNETEWYNNDNFTNLTVALSYTSVGWYSRTCTSTNEPYRYVFCHNPSNNGWAGQAAELQLYGWPASATADKPVGVRDLSVTQGDTPNLSIAWAIDLGDVSTYDIERREDGGEWHAVATGLAVGTSAWTDTAAPYDGTMYEYRVVSRNGGEVAYSKSSGSRPYQHGGGTGLHAEWWTNYVTTTGGEALALVATNASINFADTSVGGEAENLLARWSGKLVAPFDGDFAFEAEATGVAYLWIDGVAVLYKGKATATKSLTGGEHDITVLWRHMSGAGSCRLCWGGCITHEVIPSTQFVPVPPREIPGEWVGARTFDVSEGNALFLGDVKANADGSIDMAHSGRDLSWGTIGYNFLWKPIKGDFKLVAKISCLPPTGDRWYGRKAGLMVRSSLDASANMRAYGVKRTVSGSADNIYVVGMHKTTATGQYVRDQEMVAGALIGSFPASKSDSVWVRLCRVGNVFTAQYKISQSDEWSLEYEYEDTNGEYGETTYVGLSAWGEGDGTYTTVPCYLWRFTNVRLHTPKGIAISLR